MGCVESRFQILQGTKCSNRAGRLQVACEKGRVKSVRSLLNEGACVNAVERYGQAPPISIATRHGCVDVLRLLLERGADVDTVCDRGETPLFIATRQRDVRCVRVLIEFGATVNILSYDGQTPVSIAIYSHEIEILTVLVASGMYNNMTDRRGETPLFIACACGNKAAVKLLLAGGALPDIANSEGETPLFIATRCRDVEMVQLLVAAHATVTLLNHDGESPFSIAIQSGDMHIVKALIANGSQDVAMTNLRGETPLFIACQLHQVGSVEMLLDGGFRPDIANSDGETSLHIAARCGDTEIVNVLLTSGARTDVLNREGNTPLFIACWHGHATVIDALLTRGACVNAVNQREQTALFVASARRKLAVMKILLSHGADPRVATNEGETPLSIAFHNGHRSVVRLLLFTARSGRDSLSSSRLDHAAEPSGSHVREQQSQQDRAAESVESHNEERQRSPSSLVLAALQTLRNTGPPLHECERMWDHVVERLQGIDICCERVVEGVVSALMEHYIMIIFRLVKLKHVNGVRSLMSRLASSREVANSFHDLHTEIDYLLKGMTPCLVAERHFEWKSRWQHDQENILETFWSIVREEHQLLATLENEQDRIEAVSLLRYELHKNRCTQATVELLQFSLHEVLRLYQLTVDLPVWFVPLEDLEILQQSDNHGHGRWLKSAVLIQPSQLAHDAFIKRVNKWHRFNHPHVIKIFGAYHLREPRLVVFENTCSVNLREYLLTTKGQSLIWQKLHEVALGLKYLHERGVVLGNLQCENIWIGTDGLAKIAECGLNSKPIEPRDRQARMVSTARSTAPECFGGRLPTVQSDIYSLGVCVLEIFLGDVSSSDESNYYGRRMSQCSTDNQPCIRLTPYQHNLILLGMCAFDPAQRVRLASVVENFKRFAADERNRRQEETSLIISGKHVESRIHRYYLETAVFAELGGTMDAFMAKLEKKTNGCKSLQKSIAQIYTRLRHIYTDIQEDGKPADHVAVTKFCQVLVNFDTFLGTEATSKKSIDERTKIQKVSLSNNVLHREIDEILDLLRIDETKSVHQWRRYATLSAAQCNMLPHASDRKTEERRGSHAIQIVRFEMDASSSPAGSGSTTSLTFNDLSESRQNPNPAWFIPLYNLEFSNEERIGCGSFGEVFKGTWLGTPVVVKYMGLEEDDDGRDNKLEMFLHEVQIWYQLHHPHVIKLFGACDRGKRFFVCEYAPNGTLLDYLRLHPSDTWEKLSEVALGLQYLHASGIIHNDLKCDNFLVGADSRVKITDFGLSCIRNKAEVKIDVKKQGAKQWRSPEYLRGERVTRASDIYSFGMCILEAIKGEPPWGSLPDAAAAFQVVRLGRLPERPSGMDDTQWNLIGMMCAFDPSRRVNISAVVEAIDAFLRLTLPA
ncbi:Serine/threonine protein kinase, partial [Globisporangium splendens]